VKEEFEFTFKAKFIVNKNSFPKGWTRTQIIESELDNFYDDPKGYIECLIDEDDYTVEIK
jgi:hypothetical protein